MASDLRRRLERLEERNAPVAPTDEPGDEVWQALAVLRHDMHHPAGAEITDAVWNELQRRLAVMSGGVRPGS